MKRKIYLTIEQSEIVVHIPYRVMIEMIKPNKDGDGYNLMDLTKREREVFDRMRRGMTNKEIASKMNLSESTVKFHASALYVKIPGVRSRYDIMARYGVVEEKSEVMVQ